uniref:hypothetical protein n=1 Tax=Escherichia coli TaxID=562 RepID=UPI0022555703
AATDMPSAAATLCFLLSVSSWWAAWVAANPVPSPVTPEDTSEVDNFDSRVSLTLEEMSALHSSTHRPHAPPVVKRSLMVEFDPPPADNSDAVVRRTPSLAHLPPQPPPHAVAARRRRQALHAPAELPQDVEDALSALPVPSGNSAEYASYADVSE